MSDLYIDFAADYEWLFTDDVVGSAPAIAATSPGSRDLLAAAVGELSPGATVLDCACGVGADALAFAQRGFKVTATDASASMVARARQRLAGQADRVTVLQAEWEQLPDRLTERYDLAICLGNAMVHAGSRKAEALRAIRAVLKPGARMVVDSRNWEFMYRSRPRIVPASRVIERQGIRCQSLYIWTIPESFEQPCRAEIVFLFEDPAGEVSHRRYELAFQPFRPAELRQAAEAAGFGSLQDSFAPSGVNYAVAGVA